MMMSDQELLFLEMLACTLEDEAREEQLARQMLEQRLQLEIALHLHAFSPPPLPHAPGLDRVMLSTLPVADWQGASRDEEMECPLCLGEYELGEQVMRLPCLHQAHEECLSKWLERSPQCPVCKLDVQESIADLFGS